MSDPDNPTPHEMSDDSNDTQVMTSYADSEDEFDDYQDFDADGGLGSHPPRPRRVLVNRWSALLAAIVIGGACFYGGVRVEKSKVGSTSTGTGASAFAALASRAGATGRGTAVSGSATGTRSGRAAAGGFGGGAAGFGGAAAGGTSGTISSISGNTLYVAETGGNTVKVNLSDTTTLTKTETVSKSKLFPGDTVSVAGTTGSNGAVKATSVTDSGASSSASTASTSSTGSTSSSSSGSSALSSLFGG